MYNKILASGGLRSPDPPPGTAPGPRWGSRCLVKILGLVTSDDTMTSLSKKLSTSIKIHVVKPL